MKKVTKIMAFLTAMTMTAGAMGVTAYAEEYEASKSADNASIHNFITYNSNNKEYEEYLSYLKLAPSEDKLIAIFDHRYNCKLSHIYTNVDNEKDTSGTYIQSVDYYNKVNWEESGGGLIVREEETKINNHKVKVLHSGIIMGTQIMYFNYGESNAKMYTVDELNTFMKENRFNAYVDDKFDLEDKGIIHYHIMYDENLDNNQRIDVMYALSQKYGLDPYYITTTDENDKYFFYEDETSSLKGDADLNGDVDLADLTTVAKYNLNNEAYPLANDTAYANADMNGDGVVDGLDTSALIENQLGK